MYEIEKFYAFDSHLISGLERWVDLQCNMTFNDENLKGTKPNDNHFKEEIALNILEWSPMESQVLQTSNSFYFKCNNVKIKLCYTCVSSLIINIFYRFLKITDTSLTKRFTRYCMKRVFSI